MFVIAYDRVNNNIRGVKMSSKYLLRVEILDMDSGDEMPEMVGVVTGWMRSNLHLVDMFPIAEEVRREIKYYEVSGEKAAVV